MSLEAKVAFRSVFFVELRRQFFPILKRLGFNGNGQTRTRSIAKAFNVIQLRADKYGGIIYVDLGIHFRFLPRKGAIDNRYCFDRLRDVDCSFRSRILPPPEFEGRPGWGGWGYGHSCETAAAAVAGLTKLFQERTEPDFQFFSDPARIAERLPLAMIDSRDYGEFLWCEASGGPALALTMARVHLFLENAEKALEFLRYGLENCKNESQRQDLLEVLSQAQI